MFKKIMICSAFACLVAQPTEGQAAKPLLEVIQTARDAQLNLKKSERYKNDKKIQAACAKGKFLSLRNNTLRSGSGKYCDGAIQAAYALLMCDTGKDAAFYKSKCFKKAVASLKISKKGNNDADRKMRRDFAKSVFFDKSVWASDSDSVLMCRALVKKDPQGGATHPTVKDLHSKELKDRCVQLIGGFNTYEELKSLDKFLQIK